VETIIKAAGRMSAADRYVLPLSLHLFYDTQILISQTAERLID